MVVVVRKDKPESAAASQGFQEGDLDARYLGYFECFNRQLFFEAHAVLEELWLPQRRGPDNGFYKGLIQLAGAFVHLQKERPGPAMALLLLARANLRPYPAMYRRLDLEGVITTIEDWLEILRQPAVPAPLISDANAPRLQLGKID